MSTVHRDRTISTPHPRRLARHGLAVAMVLACGASTLGCAPASSTATTESAPSPTAVASPSAPSQAATPSAAAPGGNPTGAAATTGPPPTGAGIAPSPVAPPGTPPPPAGLPGGGTRILGGKLYVALYGHPSTAALGLLGEQGTAATIRRAKQYAARYRPHTKRTVVPALEIIATIASASAGADGDYSRETPVRTLRPLVDAARAAGVYVVLDLQPGRTDFLTQAKRYRSLLLEPHVGLALDPEWRLKPKQRHLRQVGSVSSAEINKVSAWLSELTATAGLPQKMLLLHQFQLSMIRDRSRLVTDHPQLAFVIQMDGQGPQPAKQDTWRALRANAPEAVRFGWKNFIDEDHPMLTPKQTMRQVKPTPVWVSYQ